MRIENASDVTVNGPSAGIRFSQVCDNNASGAGGPPGAVCTGRGNVKLVNKLPAS